MSWMLIEKGWPVVDANGDRVGRVEEVDGDTQVDIFSGLRVLTGLLGKPKFVPAEEIAEIVEGEITLALTKDDVDRLKDDGP